jgi:hypothetical protein
MVNLFEKVLTLQENILNLLLNKNNKGWETGNTPTRNKIRLWRRNFGNFWIPTKHEK